MKKMISYALFASLALFASCSQDETLEQTTNAPGVLSFTTNLPTEGTQTKVADAKVQRYIMQLFYENAEGAMTTFVLNPSAEADDYSGQATMENATGTFTIDGATLGLAEGTTYTAVFWADYNAVDAASPTYNADFLNWVEYKGDLSNTPMTMAYCGTSQFTYGEDMAAAYSVTLRRAVAQINFVQSEGFTPTAGDNVYVSYTHYNVFNALEGEIETGENTSWQQSATIATLTATPIAADETIGSILTFASAASSITSNFSFYYNDAEAGAATNVPLQANYQTNITGNYYATSQTTTATFTVATDDAWGGTANENEFDTADTTE